jgi:hypothetical protein
MADADVAAKHRTASPADRLVGKPVKRASELLRPVEAGETIEITIAADR